jgi:hypothetical protein
MKRRLLSALVLGVTMFGARPAAGQQRGGVTLGGIFGYSRAGLSGSDAQNVSSRTSTLAGAFIRIPVAEWFAVEPEILFSRKGGTTTATLPAAATPSQLDFEFVYVELPLLLRARAPAIRGIFRPMVFGGPAVSFDIGCDINVNQSSSAVRGTCQEAGLQPTSVDASMVAGGGLDLRLGNSSLGLEVRYSWSLRPVFQNDVDIKNHQFGLLLEVPF